MAANKLISAACHIVEPPDMYTWRIEPRFRDRAPRMERRKTPTGREYDAWMLGGMQVGTLGAVMQAGQRFEDPSQIDFLGVWEDVRKGGYDPHAMIRANEEDGVWGACVQPSQGLSWYRIPDSELLSEVCRIYNDWVGDFCKPYPERLKGIGMLNVDDVDEGCQELERIKKLGLVGALIPVSPLPDRPYSHPMYERLWWTAQDLAMPLLLHIATPRNGTPGNEFTMNVAELTGAGRSTTDYWVRYSLSSMLFAGVFDRYPRLKVGSVEHETAWIPHWLQQMDFTYRERPVFTKGWRSREGLLPTDYWRRNMFVEFMEDELGVQLRDRIGVETMLWGNDFPHAESTWPKSQDFLDRLFAATPEQDRRKITFENAASLFGFSHDGLFTKELPVIIQHLNPYTGPSETIYYDPVNNKSDYELVKDKPRRVNAWIDDVTLPLIKGHTYRFNINIGMPRDNALAAPEFIEPDWHGQETLEVLVLMSGSGFKVSPGAATMVLPRSGNSEAALFYITPVKIGSLLLRISLYLAPKLVLIEQFELSVEVSVARKVA